MGFRTGKRLSSPFSKGGPRPARHRSRSGEAGGGILLRGRPPEDHRYILTVQAKINPMTPPQKKCGVHDSPFFSETCLARIFRELVELSAVGLLTRQEVMAKFRV